MQRKGGQITLFPVSTIHNLFLEIDCYLQVRILIPHIRSQDSGSDSRGTRTVSLIMVECTLSTNLVCCTKYERAMRQDVRPVQLAQCRQMCANLLA